MKESARYAKVVEWSDEDECNVGSCPGLLWGDATEMTNAPCSKSSA